LYENLPLLIQKLFFLYRNPPFDTKNGFRMR
jgi:hypothetical protein